MQFPVRSSTCTIARRIPACTPFSPPWSTTRRSVEPGTVPERFRNRPAHPQRKHRYSLRYVDGVLQFSAVDTVDPAVFDGPGGIIHFFTDDTKVTGDDPTGTVHRIRIYDGAVTSKQAGDLDAISTATPESATLGLLGAALAGLVVTRRIKRS